MALLLTPMKTDYRSPEVATQPIAFQFAVECFQSEKVVQFFMTVESRVKLIHHATVLCILIVVSACSSNQIRAADTASSQTAHAGIRKSLFACRPVLVYQRTFS
jgi:hypothetical protein